MYTIYINLDNKTILLTTNNIKILESAVKFCNICGNPFLPTNSCNEKLVILISKKKSTKNMQCSYSDFGHIYYKFNKRESTLTVLIRQIKKEYMFSLVKVLIMILLAYREKFYILHSSIVTLQNKRFLIPGPSQTGKSTLALMLSKFGATILCDDYVVITKEQLLNCDCIIFLYNINNKFSSLYEYELLYDSFVANSFFMSQDQINKIILQILKTRKIIRLRKEGINKTYYTLKKMIGKKLLF